MMAPETARQLVHIAMGAFAFALPWLTWRQAAACALAALVVNLFVLPRVAGNLFRSAEHGGRTVGGIVFYPLSVLLLVLVFPTRPDIVAAAWGILAAGDGVATLAGRAFGGPRLPWNPQKTWAGTAAFALVGGGAATVLLWWSAGAADPAPPGWFVWSAGWIAAAQAALVETVPVRLDDNLSVPATAGASLWALSLVSPAAAATALPVVASRLTPALAVNALAALGGYRAGTVTVSGTAVGFAIGLLTWIGAGPAGWALLFACYAVASVASRIGVGRKVALGIAEARGGRRGPGNALANCGLATIAALLAVAGAEPAWALLVFVTALVAGASDTVASEVGKAFGRTTLLVTTLRRVPAGTSGALSVEGTAAGVLSAAALAVAASAGALVPPGWIWVVVAAATVGGLVESALGATLEAGGVLNNDLLNFLNTAIAALAAVALARSVA